MSPPFLLKYFLEFAYYFAVGQYVCQLKKQCFFFREEMTTDSKEFLCIQEAAHTIIFLLQK
jgi:hypothetical protein